MKSGDPRQGKSRPSDTLASASKRAYASDWAAFTSWCLLNDQPSLPASVTGVIAYFETLTATVRVATLRRKLVSITQNHRVAGCAFPLRDVRMLDFFRGIAEGVVPAPRASPSAATVRCLLEALPRDLSGIRDRALILLGWSMGSRPAELVGLDAGDVAVEASAATLQLTSGWGRARRRRTVVVEVAPDPDACPVRWLRSWLQVARIRSGPVFRSVSRFGRVGAGRMSVQAVRLVVRRAALRAGLRPEGLTGDGLRGRESRRLSPGQ